MQKPLYPLLCLLAAFFACNEPAEKENEEPATVSSVQKEEKPDSVSIKLRPVIEKIASEDLQQGGYTLSFLKVDSLSYKLVSIKDFYRQRKEKLDNEREVYKKINQKLAASGAPINRSKIQDDSVKTVNAEKILNDLYNHADTAKNIYLVSYHLNARTNAAAYNTSYTKYLYARDLQEVKLHFPDAKK